ncbi:MAG: hypothetical protein EOP88_07785 [Verrucomicrobiaceae bacterium]|nr:MAG: hypothetical protein EOP88_07785 [Verrucomicrobiaceae bacterium]
MYDPPLAPADPDSVIVRKKRFWWKSLWFSVTATIVPVVAGMLISAVVVSAAMGKIPDPSTDAEMDGLHFTMIVAFLLNVAGFLLSALGLVWLVVSLIRYFTLPKVAP